MHSILFLSRFVFDEFITKWGGYGDKVDRTLANWVDERTNMINNYLSKRDYIESVKRVDFRRSVSAPSPAALVLCPRVSAAQLPAAAPLIFTNQRTQNLAVG
jgi:hypothetical protein